MEVYFTVKIWYYGEGSSVSAVQLQQMVRGSGGKIHRGIKARKNDVSGDAGRNYIGKKYCGFDQYSVGIYAGMIETAEMETWKRYRTTTAVKSVVI